MKLWIAIVSLVLLAAPQVLAGDSPGADESSTPDNEVAESDADRDRQQQRRDIEAHLAHHHELPDRQTLEAVSDNAREIVFEIARDEDALLMRRQQAMKALVAWPDEEVYDYLVGLLDDETTEDGLRHHLLPAIANGFGDDALDDLRPYLFEASDPQIRISAAGAIANIDSDRADTLLTRALEREDHPLVQTRLADYIDGEH